MKAKEKLKARILEFTAERKEIMRADDGYYVWWPSREYGGYHDAHSLRILAEILDEKNKDWDEHVRRELGGLDHDQNVSHSQEGETSGSDGTS